MQESLVYFENVSDVFEYPNIQYSSTPDDAQKLANGWLDWLYHNDGKKLIANNDLVGFVYGCWRAEEFIARGAVLVSGMTNALLQIHDENIRKYLPSAPRIKNR